MIYSNDFRVNNSPVIAWDTIMERATLSASSTATDYGIDDLQNSMTTAFWKPSTMPANITIETHETEVASVLAFAAHDMYTNGVSVTLEYHNGTSWAAVRTVTPQSDAPFMVSFPPVDADQWRVSFSGGVFKVAVMFLGDAMHVPNQIGAGHTPLYAASEIETLGGSEGSTGEFLQSDFYRTGGSTSIDFLGQRPEFALSEEFELFRQHYNRKRPFFIACTPRFDPRDVGFVWNSGQSLVTSYQDAVFMDISIKVSVYVK